jgi:putative YphP/YqiW family bacilliredoxin
MYDPNIVQPMREELTKLGFIELKTPEEVDEVFGGQARAGTTLLVVNSVCGCAAGNARPAVGLSLMDDIRPRPDRMLTVFAGQDEDATARVRSYMPEVPPSSPSMFLIKEGQLVHLIHRHRIQGRAANDIAQELVDAYSEHCGPAVEVSR